MSDPKKTKVSLIIESLKESKCRYIQVLTKTGVCAMKIKLNVDGEELVKFLDDFYDAGFIIERITKEDFDDYDADEKLSFNL